MSDKEMALNQINAIHAIIERTLTTTFSSIHMIAIGIGVAAIPIIEFAFDHTIDPIVESLGIDYIKPLTFLMRTAFYWLVFANFTKLIPQNKTALHPFIKKLLSIFTVYPLIPVSTAAALAHMGYTTLIAPIVLILIGSIYVILGRFTPWIVSAVAWSWILAGLVGICISDMAIQHLWQYQVIFQGLGLIIIGLYMRSIHQS